MRTLIQTLREVTLEADMLQVVLPRQRCVFRSPVFVHLHVRWPRMCRPKCTDRDTASLDVTKIGEQPRGPRDCHGDTRAAFTTCRILRLRIDA